MNERIFTALTAGATVALVVLVGFFVLSAVMDASAARGFCDALNMVAVEQSGLHGYICVDGIPVP